MEATQTAVMPPEATLVQIVLTSWSAKVIAAVTSLDVADVLHRHGPATAAELVQRHGIDANPDALERCLRACAAMGIFSEDAQGRFGPTPMSEPLTMDSHASVKKLVECFAGNAIWRGFLGLPKSIQT